MSNSHYVALQLAIARCLGELSAIESSRIVNMNTSVAIIRLALLQAELAAKGFDDDSICERLTAIRRVIDKNDAAISIADIQKKLIRIRDDAIATPTGRVPPPGR
jgi:hypothetical protein